jgi:hypothetical protein
MTVQKAIELARALRPCELGEDTLTQLLMGLESELALLVRGEEPCAPCKAVSRDTLTVPAPFDRVYWTYLVSIIDFSAGKTDCYTMSSAMFREARDAYAKWVQRTGGGT